jgi:hypothetical protein
MPRLPSELNPREISNVLGISLSSLAMRLNVSYHTLQGWARRDSAPQHTIDWIRTGVARITAELAKERSEMSPEDLAKAISRPATKPKAPPKFPPGVKGLVPRGARRAEGRRG